MQDMMLQSVLEKENTDLQLEVTDIKEEVSLN